MRIHCEKGTWTVSLWPEFTGIGDFGTVRCSGCPFFYSWGPFWGQFSSIRWAQRWKAHIESWFSGILTSSEIVSADRYSLFVGVLKKRFVWILLGILICQAVFARILFYAGAVYLAFTSAIAVCVLTMHAGIYGILRFSDLYFRRDSFIHWRLTFYGSWSWSRRMEKRKSGYGWWYFLWCLELYLRYS